MLIDPDRPPAPGWLRIEQGRIVELQETGDGPPDAERSVGGPGRLITPGFIDAHCHPPQIDSIGCDDLPLLEWLKRVVFPAEIWWGKGAAAALMRRAMRTMLSAGTTGFAGYLTSHGVASRDAIAQLEQSPAMRCVVGRVAMDRHAPADLIAEDRGRTAQSAVSSVACADSSSQRISISVNPRFALACTEELLAEVGWFVADHPGVTVQTHLAEAPAECELVSTLFPDDPNYASVYDRFGLLTPQTLLAHCLHLSAQEWELIVARGSVVAHCPAANVFLGSGLFDLDQAREHGVRLALGSDVAAGPSVAMPNVGRAMIEMAKCRKMTIAPMAHIPTPAEVWRQITSGNADALGWTDAGRLAVGAEADLLVLRPPETWFDDHLVGRLLYNWSRDLIDQRIVAGEPVDPATI